MMYNIDYIVYTVSVYHQVLSWFLKIHKYYVHQQNYLFKLEYKKKTKKIHIYLETYLGTIR